MSPLKRIRCIRAILSLFISIALHVGSIAGISAILSQNPFLLERHKRLIINAYSHQDIITPAPEPQPAHQQADVFPVKREAAQPLSELTAPASQPTAEPIPEFSSEASEGIEAATEPVLLNARLHDASSPAELIPGTVAEAKTDPALATGAEFKRLFSVALAFPEAARRTGRSGAVSLVVGIDAAGFVEAVRITASSGSSLLDAAARTAVTAIPSVPPPGRRLEFAIRAVFTAGKASLSP
jgi:TonB family protein